MKYVLGLLAVLCLFATETSAATCTGPAPAENGSRFYTEFNEHGFAALWYCKDGNGWEPQGLWGHWGELEPDWLMQVPKLLYGTDADRATARQTYLKPATVDYSTTVYPLYMRLRGANDPAYPKPVLKVCMVPPQSGTVQTRQVYRANTAGTGIGTAITGVRVQQGTVCGARLGTTNYYSVAGQKDTLGRVIAAGYAIGVITQ